MKWIWTLMVILILTSCVSPQTPPTTAPVSTDTPPLNMPNPASVYCEEQGYTSEIRTAADGSQSGVCIFPNGSECEEWMYYRGECSPEKLTVDKLVIETFELTGRPNPETLEFSSVNGREFSAADFEISVPFPSNQMEGTPLRLTVSINGDVIVASEDTQPSDFEMSILVTRNNEPIFRTDAGQISPIEPVQGLWTFDGHWVLETNLFLTDKPFNGQVFVDGEALNQKNGYEESFKFQTLNSRPFYFFRRNGKVDAWFDGKEIPLGFDDIPHYLCCGDSGLNPKARQGAVLFFGNNGSKWYFVRIAAPGVLDQ